MPLMLLDCFDPVHSLTAQTARVDNGLYFGCLDGQAPTVGAPWCPLAKHVAGSPRPAARQ